MRRTSTLLRWVLATLTAIVVCGGLIFLVNAGSNRHYNVVFFAVLMVSLVPAGLYAFIVRNDTTTIVCGSLLLLLTASSWLVVVVSQEDLALVYPILAFFVTLAISLWAAVYESRIG